MQKSVTILQIFSMKYGTGYYRREMETPVEDMKRFMDGLLHIYDEGRTKMKIGDLLDMSSEARERLNGQN